MVQVRRRELKRLADTDNRLEPPDRLIENTQQRELEEAKARIIFVELELRGDPLSRARLEELSLPKYFAQRHTAVSSVSLRLFLKT